MGESIICPVCEQEIPADAELLCPHCHFELKWLGDDGEIERAKQSFTGKLSKVEESPLQKRKTLSYFYHLLVCILGGGLPWVVTWWIFPYELFSYFGIRIGLVIGFVFGYFTYRYEIKNRKPDDGPYVFLFRSFMISVLLTSPFLCILIMFSLLYAS